MKTSIRLDQNLIQEAELEGRSFKRSAPNQIEYWAEIGRQVESLISPNELVAIRQGFARLHIEDALSHPAEADDIFKAVDADSAAGTLTTKVTQSTVYYEASQTHPGQLDRVDENKQRETGRFRDGQFESTTR